MSEIPKQIKSGGEYLTVIEEPLKKAFGYYIHEQRVIKLDSGTPLKIKINTLLHELLHHIDMTNGLNISHRAIYTLTDRLLALLYDNPELLKLLDIYCKTTYNYFDMKFKIVEALENVTKK